MKCRAKTLIIAALGLCAMSGIAGQSDAAGGYEAQAAATKDYALKALAVYRASGPTAAIADYMTPKKWRLGPEGYNLHIAVTNEDATLVFADSGFPELVGLSWSDVDDLDGLSLGKTVTDGLAKSPGGASLQLRFNNPTTKAVAHAEGYCLRPDPKHILCAWSEA